MLTRSDNVATNVLIDVVGRARATAFAERTGLGATAVRRKLSGALPLIDDPGGPAATHIPRGTPRGCSLRSPRARCRVRSGCCAR